jgi:hypothetical protein
MIIKFETLEGFDNLRLVEPTWRGDSGDLVVDENLSKIIHKLNGNTDDKTMSFEISSVTLPDSERFTRENIKKGLPGVMYTHSTLGIHYICELLLLYVGPEYPENFYIRKIKK